MASGLSNTASVWEVIQKLAHLQSLAADAALRSIGLTSPQYFALAALAAQSGLSGAALARRCLVTPQTMTGILANLAASGLIAREPDPEHGRIIRTSLTPGGAELFARARVLVDGIETEMLRDIDPVEREALTDLLLQCAQALGARRKSPRG